MTGIDRLRAIAGAWNEWGLGGTLAEIADEIERERAEDCYRMGLDHGTVWRVVADMERHCLGHEGMEDSPVARWARELRGALKSDASDGPEAQNPSCTDPDGAADVTSEAPKVTRDPAEDVSMSAYDLLPSDERDAIAWVREHGGLDRVRAEWRSRVPRDLYERRRQRLLGHIAECETALGRRNVRIEKLGRTIEFFQLNNSNFRHLLADVAERLGFTRFGDDYEPEDLLDALDRRLMPEGCEWPTVDGRKVDFKTPYQPSLGVLEAVSIYNNGAVEVMSHDGIIKPVSEIHVVVLASDGEPLEVGQTVWDTDAETDTPLTVVEVSSDLVRCEYTWKDGKTYRPCYLPSALTHERPDTWERLEEDAGKDYTNYWGCERVLCSDCPAIADGKNPDERYNVCHCAEAMKCDIVRRAKALAERERSEA